MIRVNEYNGHANLEILVSCTMNIQYKNIRKINRPMTEEEIKSYGEIALDIDCGYLEVLLRHGTGQIAGGIDIIHPKGLKSATEEHLQYVQDDAKRPKWLAKDWKSELTLVAGSASRTSYWYHPKCKNGMLIYDGDFDEVFFNPWGFADPRHGFLDEKMYYGRNFELIFDSNINVGEICASGNGKTAVVVNQFFSKFMKDWHSPNDITHGDIYNNGLTVLYLHKIGGYIKVENRTNHSIIDMVSISFDLDYYKDAKKMIKQFGDAGYKIHDYTKEKGS